MALDIFMNLKNAHILGESTDALSAGMIQLQSFRMAIFSSTFAKIHKTPQAAFTEPDQSLTPVQFTITKGMDTSTTALFLNYFQAATVKPNPIEEAEVLFRYPTVSSVPEDKASYLILTFSQLFVCQYSMELEIAADQTTRPVETLLFRFERYRITYQSQPGTISPSTSSRPLGWDFVNNKVW